MKNTLFFTTDKGNLYLFSPYRNHFRLTHPLIQYFFEQESSGKPLPGWFFSGDPDEEISIPETGSFSRSKIRYQHRKYRFLKKHHYFKPLQMVNLDGRISTTDVKGNIASVKQIIFEVTEDCNLNCTYCTYSKYYQNEERKNRYLRFEDVKYTLDTLIQKRKPSPENQLIISFYGGEPLKNFRFIEEVVKYTKEFPSDQIHFKYTMSSNALLLRKYTPFLIEHNFEISISLDGDEAANAFRVTKNNKPSYKIITAALDHIHQHYPGYFQKNVHFLTVLHSKNTYLSVYRYFKDRYGKSPMISEVNPVNLNPEYAEEFKREIEVRPSCSADQDDALSEMKTLHPKSKEMTEVAQNYSGFVFRNFPELISPKAGKPKTRKRLPTATCMPFSIRVFFNAAGNIIPCEHISASHVIGSYTRDSLNVNPEKIAQKYNEYYDRITQLCKKCYFADNCQDCMFNTNIRESRTTCSFFTGEAGFRNYLRKGFSQIEQDYPLFLTVANQAFHEE